jgi:hypothetical protein
MHSELEKSPYKMAAEECLFMFLPKRVFEPLFLAKLGSKASSGTW